MSERKKSILNVAFLLLLNGVCLGQLQDEYVIHLKSIEDEKASLKENALLFHTTNANLALFQEVIREQLEDPSHFQFLCNRKLLKRFSLVESDSTHIRLSNNNGVELKIWRKRFRKEEHVIILIDDTYCCSTIDSLPPFGANYAMPTFEISKIELSVNGEILSVPKEAFSNLYNYYFIDKGEHPFFRPMEAYESINGEFFYLYIYGGYAADTYFGKLIFSKEGYIGKIFVDYDFLLNTRSLRDDFIGF
ncbi:MAG: hypothetical protein GC193_10490 [Cryomorphaceae bacterium]|nr:hypothetical protein [Cryomorphaceae bacterium]